MRENKSKPTGSESFLGKIITRRKFLERASDLVKATVLVPFLGKESFQSNEIQITLGPEEEVLPVDFFNLNHIPDTHTTLLKDESGVLNVFLTADKSSYLLKGHDLKHLRPHQVDDKGWAVPILKPEITNLFGKNYQGLGAVFKGTKPNQMIGIFHAEDHPSKSENFYASIGLVESFDGGATWQNPVKIISGRNEAVPGTRVTGVGTPNAIVVGSDVYLFYIDWGGGPKPDFPGSIHVAKAPLAECTNPEAWKKFNGRGFMENGLGGDSIPVINPAEPESYPIRYATYPSVSFHPQLGFFMAFEGDTGFYYSSSTDLVSWTSAVKFFAFQSSQQGRLKPEGRGRVWYSFPTVINSQETSDTQTGSQNYLICSIGVQGIEPHHMVRFPLVIDASSPSPIRIP